MIIILLHFAHSALFTWDYQNLYCIKTVQSWAIKTGITMTVIWKASCSNESDFRALNKRHSRHMCINSKKKWIATSWLTCKTKDTFKQIGSQADVPHICTRRTVNVDIMWSRLMLLTYCLPRGLSAICLQWTYSGKHNLQGVRWEKTCKTQDNISSASQQQCANMGGMMASFTAEAIPVVAAEISPVFRRQSQQDP